MEYSLISFDEYEKCQEIARRILQDASQNNNRSTSKLRAPNIINTLNSEYSPNVALYYSSNQKIKSETACLTYWNQLFDMNNVYVHARKIAKVDEIFTDTVAGLTNFDGEYPTLFINAGNSLQRMLFTLLHEFTHMYQAEGSLDYVRALAMINADKMNGTSYPAELQPVEDEANTVASLLMIPDATLKRDIHKLSFYQLKNKYQISSSALFNRLRSYFYYSTDFDEYESNQAAQAFSINDHKLIHHVRKELN